MPVSSTSAPLRVLVVTNMYPTQDAPAYGAFIETEVQALKRLDGAVDRIEVEFVNGRESRAAYLRTPFRISRLLRENRIDVVHAHYGLTGFFAAFHPVPLVVTFHGDDLWGTRTDAGANSISLKSRVARRFAYLAARRADALICHSEPLRAALPRPEDRARARVIPMGVDVARFQPGDRAAARRRLGVSADERLVLFATSRQQPVKRFDLAQHAIATLAESGLTARLWDVEGVPHAEMPDYYRAADCLLVTSDRESGPMVVKEAICCDVPVVSVDVGDARRWTELAGGSKLVEREPRAIARALRDVLCGSPRVDGSAVRAELAADRIAKRIIDVYHEAIASRAH